MHGFRGQSKRRRSQDIELRANSKPDRKFGSLHRFLTECVAMGNAWTHHPNLGSAPTPERISGSSQRTATDPEMEVVAGMVSAATGTIPDWSAACHTAVDVAFSAQFDRMAELSSINVEFSAAAFTAHFGTIQCICCDLRMRQVPTPHHLIRCRQHPVPAGGSFRPDR